MTVLSSGNSSPSTSGASLAGIVVEAFIDGRLAWLVEPTPQQPYTFTFDLAQGVSVRYCLSACMGHCIH